MRDIVDLTGKEGSCVHAESGGSSCIVVKVSGIEPDRLMDLWVGTGKGRGLHLSAGATRYPISSMLTSGDCALLEVTVPKGTTEFDLIVGEQPGPHFTAATEAAPKVSYQELCAGPKKGPDGK